MRQTDPAVVELEVCRSGDSEAESSFPCWRRGASRPPSCPRDDNPELDAIASSPPVLTRLGDGGLKALRRPGGTAFSMMTGVGDGGRFC